MPRTTQKSLLLITAAVLGAVLFDGFTLAVVAGEHTWGSGREGQMGPALWVMFVFLVQIPGAMIGGLFGVSPTDPPSFFNSELFYLLVNGVAGAVTFVVLTYIWLLAADLLWKQPHSDSVSPATQEAQKLTKLSQKAIETNYVHELFYRDSLSDQSDLGKLKAEEKRDLKSKLGDKVFFLHRFTSRAEAKKQVLEVFVSEDGQRVLYSRSRG